MPLKMWCWYAGHCISHRHALDVIVQINNFDNIPLKSLTKFNVFYAHCLASAFATAVSDTARVASSALSQSDGKVKRVQV